MAPRRRRVRRRRGTSGVARLEYQFSHILNVTDNPNGYSSHDVSFGEVGVASTRPCKVESVRVSMSCTAGGAGTYSLVLFGPPIQTETNSISIRSPIRTVGSTTTSLSIRQPAVTDFYTPASSDLLFRLEAYRAQPSSGTVVHLVVSGVAVVVFQRRSAPVNLKS